MTTEISRRNVLALGLAGITVGLLAGCSSTDSSSAGKDPFSGKTKGAMKSLGVNEQFKATAPLAVSLLFQDNPAYPEKSSWEIWQDINDKTNVSFKPTIVPYADYNTKRSLLINSGNAPDIIAKTYPGSETQFVGGGAIVAASDYTQYMPNFTDKVKKWKLDPDLATIRQADGKYYVFPGLHETLFLDYTIGGRTDILKADGIDTPTTWDEFRDVLKKVKQKHPEVEYPFSDRWLGASTLNLAATAWGTMAGANWGIGSGLRFDSKSQKFSFAPASAAFKDLLKFFAGLVKDGLMDPESFTQSDDQALAKFETGKSYFINMNAQTLVLSRTSMEKNLGAGAFSIAKLPVPAGPLGKVVSGSRLENGIMVSTSATKRPDFKALLQFIDWLWYSDDAQAFLKWGIEGKTYEVKDGKYELLPGYKLSAYGFGDPNAKTDIRNDMGFSCGNFMYAGTTKIVDSTMPPEELAWQKVMSSYKQLPPSPAVPYTPTQLQQATLQQTALIDTANTATLNFILGKQDFSEWDSYVSSLKSKGMQTYVDNANRYYAKLQKKLG
ncbi:extracellular solute-binding protein [Rathayibacter sp. KR2-224]|uniref:extracellular solute-binding protein n=1 Tax=Rathayibacter sp. KR2-224 TaxID=3400913 RepID=UPI003C0CA3C5